MLTVGACPARVESELVSGVLTCPGCAGELRPWSHGARRVLRRLACGARLIVRPRRARCRSCRVTHVLLPANVLLRRADEVAVVGRVLSRAAVGEGYGRIAAGVGRSVWTVRSWVRRARGRARGRASVLRSALAEWIVALDPDPPALAPAPTMLGDAVVALAAMHRAALARWSELVARVTVWELAVAVTNGSLLAPRLTIRMINTSMPLVTFGD